MALITSLDGGGRRMMPVLIASRSMKSYELETYQVGAHRLHQVKVTGPISLSERIALYVQALDLNESSDLFCVVDNSEGHPNELRYQDMKFLDDMIVNYGIRRFFGATITPDVRYSMVVAVAKETAEESGLQCDLIATGDRQSAEEFVLKKMTDVTT